MSEIELTGLSGRKVGAGVQGFSGKPECHWGCGTTVAQSPYRTWMLGTPGLGRWIVCGPDCAKRPEGVSVFTAHEQKGK